uniref:Peptidase S1 domain-containing protein n=1 Tax=Equus caballus TaxID=9796 RepID=A0A9L0S5N5_HORSE
DLLSDASSLKRCDEVEAICDNTHPGSLRKGKPQATLGAHSTSHKEKHDQIFAIKKAISYPCYDPQSFEGALQLQLEGKATITKATKTGDVKPHTKFHVAGRGSTKRDSCKISNTLREVNVTVIDQKLCNDVEHYNFTPVIDNSMIRAGPRKGEDDS